MSHCDFEYFKNCEGLVKSIRHSGNEHHIILKLLDFNEEQKEYAHTRLKNIENIDLDFIDSNETEFWTEPGQTNAYYNDKPVRMNGNPRFDTEASMEISDNFKLYTECRPFLLYDIMKDNNDDILSLCANALILTKLDDIEKALKNKDLMFKERPTWFGLEKVEDVESISKGQNLLYSLSECHRINSEAGFQPHKNSEYSLMVDYVDSRGGRLNLRQICHLPISRVVLIGALGISNNPLTKQMIKTWKENILQEREDPERFFTSFKVENTMRHRVDYNQNLKIVGPVIGDTREDDSFVRAYIETNLNQQRLYYGRKLVKETNFWDGDFTDTSCTSDKIWFGKGSARNGGGKAGKGKRYLEKLNFFVGD